MSELVHAVWNERAADVVALLAGGADVNEASVGGYTPLIIACYKRNLVVVTTLLAANKQGRRDETERKRPGLGADWSGG